MTPQNSEAQAWANFKNSAAIAGAIGPLLIGGGLYSLIGYAGIAIAAGIYMTLLWVIWTLGSIIGTELKMHTESRFSPPPLDKIWRAS